MQPYLELIRSVIESGSWNQNRTGIRTLSLPGAMMRFDLAKGFPAVTTKKLAFKSAIGEMVGFLRATRSAADMRALGSKVWDQNANENAAWLANPYRTGTDDLGEVYGAVWRGVPTYKRINLDSPNGEARLANALAAGYSRIGWVENEGRPGRQLLLYKAVDQLRNCLDLILNDPGDRRILFHGWNWAQLDEMALPPCHLLYQFLVDESKRELSMCLYVRSNDIGLGAPYNAAAGAALMHLVGRLTGYRPRWFTYFIADAHIYENHLPMLTEQLKREPLPAPRLKLSERIPDFAHTGIYAPEWLDRVEPEDFQLEGYQHHTALTAPMAV